MNKQLIFATLGLVGTCHELATQYKIEFQEVANAKIELMKKSNFTAISGGLYRRF